MVSRLKSGFNLCEKMLFLLCLKSGMEFQRAVNVQDYSAKYVLSVDEDEPEEEVLLIDQRNGIIDL